MEIRVRRRTLEALAVKLDLESEDIREDYSGRGMYDAECVGFVSGGYAGFPAMLALAAIEVAKDVDDPWDDPEDEFLQIFSDFDSNSDGLWEFFRDARSDNMGYGTIWYFPGLRVYEDDKRQRCEICGEEFHIDDAGNVTEEIGEFAGGDDNVIAHAQCGLNAGLELA